MFLGIDEKYETLSIYGEIGKSTIKLTFEFEDKRTPLHRNGMTAVPKRKNLQDVFAAM